MMIIVDVTNGAIYAENEADPRCRQRLADWDPLWTEEMERAWNAAGGDGRVSEDLSFRTGTKPAR